MQEGPVSGRRIKRRTIRNTILIIVSLIIVATLFAGASIFLRKNQEAAQQAQQEAQENTANQIAEIITTPLAVANDQLKQLSGQEAIQLLFKAGDQAALNEKAETLVNDIAGALKLRFLLPGKYALDRESRPPLSFASLDLLKQAEENVNTVATEFHGFGGDDPHIVMVRRVTDADRKLLGLIHLSLDPGTYISFDQQKLVAGKYIELLQGPGTSALVLGKSGQEQLRQGEPFKFEVPDTRWRIAIWESKTAINSIGSSGESGIFGMLVYIVPVALLLIIGGLLVMRRRQDVETEEVSDVVYGGAVKAIMQGQPPGLEKLIHNKPAMGQKAPVTPVSKGMAGDDITHFAKQPAVKSDTASKKKPPATVAPVVSPVTEKTTKPSATPAEAPDEVTDIDPVIFRAYDIRGKVGETLTASIVQLIGRAIGTEADTKDQKTIVVGRDGRNSSPELAEALIRGLRASGRAVIDIDMVPTPLLYFATHHLNTGSGVMVTGSHNGPEYNGLKIVINGETLSGPGIQMIRERIESGEMTSGQGDLQSKEIIADYIRRATEDIPVALGGAFRLVIDGGNGVAGIVAPQLYRALGHDVMELYCDVDGSFPKHQPDPSQPENLKKLIEVVKAEQADLGLAFDGDGDRLGVIDGEGNIIWPDRLLMLLARDVLSRNPGSPVIYDVKCSSHLKTVIESSGGKPLMWKTGHSLLKAKMQEENAPLAGEMSGHIFFKERWYGFDDALYAGARLIEILTQSKAKPTEIFAELPGGVATPELRIPLAEKHHEKFMQAIKKKMNFDNAEVSDIDGIRVDFKEGWGLIRPSNTSPNLIARFEANDQAALEKIQSDFRTLIQSITPDLKLPF